VLKDEDNAAHKSMKIEMGGGKRKEEFWRKLLFCFDLKTRVLLGC
jgi:hypothetical protein